MVSGLEEALSVKFPADLNTDEARAFLVQLVRACNCVRACVCLEACEGVGGGGGQVEAKSRRMES